MADDPLDKIRVLWLDDQVLNVRPHISGPYADYFDFEYACGPADVIDLAGQSGRNPGGPRFDVLLTDLCLCTDHETCGTAHAGTGTHAPAAGLLIGLLTALRH